MFLRHLDLTTALRPALRDEESLVFVQDGVGLYEGKHKIPNYQNGHAYLTTHRVCYIDNQDPRSFSVAVDLKDVDRCEFYAGFLKSSAKITIFPKPNLVKAGLSVGSSTIGSKVINNTNGIASSSPGLRPGLSPTPLRDPLATWICPICGFSNKAPAHFDPAIANQHTPLPPCQACGIKPPLALLIKVVIAARSNRASGPSQNPSGTRDGVGQDGEDLSRSRDLADVGKNRCPRCTFLNHPSLSTCEICGALLPSPQNHSSVPSPKPSSPVESPAASSDPSIIGDETIETIKLSFRAGGEKMFHERLRSALVQRKWLLRSAPPVPKLATAARASGEYPPTASNRQSTSTPPPPSQQRIIGIAGLERRGAELRQNNQAVIGTAFEDLEALMTSAKEVIAMAEEFARRTRIDGTDEDRDVLLASESALGLTTTKEMLGGGSAAETLYVSELARNLAEFLTDDRRGVLRREGGVMSLVDLWAVFNRARKGEEYVSPLDFERAARTWDQLNLPIRLRRFKSGLLVVQERGRSDEKTIASLIAWLREPTQTIMEASLNFGRGVTAQETAEKFGWSVGVAVEELEMAEETGALCRDQCIDGIRFWENHFKRFAGANATILTPAMRVLEV